MSLETTQTIKDSKPKERAIIFIDGNNLHRGLLDCYKIKRLDIEPYCKALVLNRDLRGIYYADSNYVQSLNPQYYQEQQQFFSHIRRIKNLVFRRGYYNTRTHPPTEKKADVYLATDMVDLCYRDEFDVAYILSGDADIAPAVDIVIREGKKVFNVYFDKIIRNSKALLPHCNGKFIEITKVVALKYEWKPPAVISPQK